MADNHSPTNKSENSLQYKKNIAATAIAAGAAGAVIGAAVGGLAGAALSNEKTRKAVQSKISIIADKARKNVKQIRDKTDKLADSGKEIVDQTKSMHIDN